MTLPDERYHSMLWAQRFLQELCDPRKTPRVPKAVRQEAAAILRHFPLPYDMDRLAARSPDIIAAKMEDLHRFVMSKHEEPRPRCEPEREPGI